MPIQIQTYDPTSGELVPLDYYDADEVSAMVHLHPSTVRRYCREGRWPHLKIRSSVYMTARHVGAAVESMTHEVDPRDPRPGEPEPPPRLGVPEPPPDSESIR